jgi:hypothetical protein
MPEVLKNKRVVAVVAGFAVIILALLFWGGGNSSPAVPNSPAAQFLSVSPALPDSSQASAAMGQELLSALALLKTISLDTSFFSDVAFKSLSDWGKVVPPQPVGRRNPFAPLSAGSGGAAKSGTSASSGQTQKQIPQEQVQPSSDADVWDFSNIDFSF